MELEIDRAEAIVTVRHHEASTADDGPGPEIRMVTIVEDFAGDLEGESTARAFQSGKTDLVVSQVSMQRFCGSLKGLRGTFVLQGTSLVSDGRIEAEWHVVPGSATGELEGLRGKGGFTGEFGRGSAATLEYWFE